MKNVLLVNQKKTDKNKKFRCRQTGGPQRRSKKKQPCFLSGDIVIPPQKREHETVGS